MKDMDQMVLSTEDTVDLRHSDCWMMPSEIFLKTKKKMMFLKVESTDLYCLLKVESTVLYYSMISGRYTVQIVLY